MESSLECGVWSGCYGLISVERGVRSVACGLLIVEWGVWCRVGILECGVKYGVRSKEDIVWSLKSEEWSVERRVWCVEYGVWSVKCDVECGVKKM